MQLALTCAFGCMWLLADWVVFSTRWHRTVPGFAAWVVIGSIQAVSCCVAGQHPTVEWTLSVWAPCEVLVLEAALLATLEATGSTLWVLGGMAAAAVLVPRGLLTWSAVGAPGWYTPFIAIREWVWTSIAIALGCHSVYLIARPKALLPSVYRCRWLLALFSSATAVLGADWHITAQAWMELRAIWRGLVIILLARWVMYCAPSTVPYLEAISAGHQNPHRLGPA